MNFFSKLETSDTLISSLRKVLVLWENNSSIHSRDIPLLMLMFFDTRNFLKHRRIPLRNDSVLWGKTIWRKIVILAPFLSLLFFDTRMFVEHRRGPLRIYKALWDKIFWKKIVMFPPSLPRSFLCIVLLSIPEVLWNTQVFTCEMFRFFETNQFRWKVATPAALSYP